MQTKSYTLNFLFLIGISLFLASCNDDDETPPSGPAPGTQSITQIVSTNANYSILRDALVAAGLDGTLNTDGPFTVFAPDNAAFNRLFDALGLEDGNADGSRVDEAVAALGADALTQVLLYHVLDGETRAAGVPTKAYVNTKSTASPAGDAIPVLLESRSQGVLVNNGRSFGTAAQNTGGNVVAADILATNGVVHGINAVMLLPSVLDVAINNPDEFSGFVNLVALGGQDSLLRSIPEVTLLIPNSAAFTSANDTLILIEQFGLSQTVALHHVIDFQTKADEFINGPYFTLNEQDVFVNVGGENILVTDAAGNVATIVPLTDIQAANGVVHTINRVLLPEF
jgi:transforming growth factor-beta-induced protein